jgi:hypothetical protein
MTFDKDDNLALKFVASITNLRTYNFKNDITAKKLAYMPTRKIKEDAGKIIPAIASTNAILAA